MKFNAKKRDQCGFTWLHTTSGFAKSSLVVWFFEITTAPTTEFFFRFFTHLKRNSLKTSIMRVLKITTNNKKISTSGLHGCKTTLPHQKALVVYTVANVVITLLTLLQTTSGLSEKMEGNL